MAKKRIGWECPKCAACYAPSVSRCWNCSGIIEAIGKPIPPYVGDVWPRPYTPWPEYVWPSVNTSTAHDPRPPQQTYNYDAGTFPRAQAITATSASPTV